MSCGEPPPALCHPLESLTILVRTPNKVQLTNILSFWWEYFPVAQDAL